MPSKIKCQLNTVGLASTLMLLFLLVAIFLPITPQASRATSDLVETDAAAKLAIALDATVGIDLMPSIAGEFGQSIANLTVSTNNPNGYKVYVAAAGESASLARTGGKGEITALTTTAQQSTFPSNSWGYALVEGSTNDNTTYRGIPTTNQEIKSETTAGEHSYQLAFGVKLDNTLPAGEYVGDIVVSVIASPAEITNFNQLVYMQDMTSSICATATENATKRLIDVRDNKAYWVAKLRDGNCWMTQNLALDLVEGEVLTSSDTDLNSKTSWVIPTSTERTVPAKITDLSADNNAAYYTARSWNLGEYVLATPNRAYNNKGWAEILCTAPGSTDGFDSAFTGQTLSQCNVFQDVTNWAPTLIAAPGSWNGENLDYVAANTSTKTYDAHYLIGNYYQANARTASSAGRTATSPSDSVTNADQLNNATDSICPKNWRLPIAGANGNTGLPFPQHNEFYSLLIAYNYPIYNSSNYIVTGIAPNKYSSLAIFTGTTDGNNQNPAKSPLHIVRNGAIYLQYGSLRHAGRAAGLASSTFSVGNLDMFGYDMTNTYINITSHTERFYGGGVRCLAR